MDSGEISLASLNCMQVLLELQISSSSSPTSSLSPNLIWSAYWETWLQIGKRSIAFVQSNCNSDIANDSSNSLIHNKDASERLNGNSNNNVIDENIQKINHPSYIFLPSTSFITLYFDLFLPIFDHIKVNFHVKDFDRLEELIQIGVLIPLYIACLYPSLSSMTSQSSTIIDDGILNSLQESVLRCLNCLVQHFSSEQSNNNNDNNNSSSSSSSLLPRVLQLLLTLTGYAVQIPKLDQLKNHRPDVVPLNYIVFAEKSLLIAVDLYQTTAAWPEMCRVEILESIIKTLHQPMALKYACPSQTTWILACRCFFQVITAGIIVISNKSVNIKSKTSVMMNKKDSVAYTSSNHALCKQIVDTIQDFLFCQNQPPSSLSIEEFQLHEELDCKFVDLISDLFLSNPAQLPEFFISRLINILSVGSVQSAVPVSITNNEGDHNTPSGEDADLMNGSHQLNSSFDHSDNKSTAPTTMHCQPAELNSEVKFPKGGLGRAVRQMNFLTTELPQDPLMNESLAWDIDLDRLRQLSFREKFARLCFSKLLSHAFSSPTNSRTSTTTTQIRLDNNSIDDNTNNYKVNAMNTSFSLMVSKTAVRSILQRCRLVLIKFYQASRLVGKCPLPRARLSEISYVFKALTVMLTSLQSVPIQQDVDDSIWSSVIELYPHIVDCVLVAGGSNQMALALHHLLRLYGEFLAPLHLATGNANDTTNKQYNSSSSVQNNINSLNYSNDISTSSSMHQNKPTSLNGIQ
ncbi:unnamed protein product [Trichobilharzia szidati]|nr:unnamed protein product [Trichobilharzia szidati]